MKKATVVLIIALALVLYASSMSYSQQTIVPELKVLLKNEPFKDVLSKIEINYWNQSISVETRGYVHFIEFLIRKATHFTGYGIIAVLFYFFYRKYNLKLAPFYAVGSAFLIGCIDEYRQSFTPGRTGIFDDVLIDTAGAILFVTIAFIWLTLRTKRQKG